MSYDATFSPYSGSLQLYIKPGPDASSTPSWSSDVVGYKLPVGDVVTWLAVTDGVTYLVYQAQTLNTALATDPFMGYISPPSLVVTSGPAENGSIYVSVGSTQTVSILCNQDISAITLEVTAETLSSKTDVAVVADGSLTKTTTTVTFALTAAMTASERTLRLTARNSTTNENYGSGLLFVTYDAQGDA